MQKDSVGGRLLRRRLITIFSSSCLKLNGYFMNWADTQGST